MVTVVTLTPFLSRNVTLSFASLLGHISSCIKLPNRAIDLVFLWSNHYTQESHCLTSNSNINNLYNTYTWAGLSRLFFSAISFLQSLFRCLLSLQKKHSTPRMAPVILVYFIGVSIVWHPRICHSIWRFYSPSSHDRRPSGFHLLTMRWKIHSLHFLFPS